MSKKTGGQTVLVILGVLLAAWVFFGALYQYDNKYTNDQPAGRDGVLTVTETDLLHPLFLIDGWKLSVDGGETLDTFIGQYSNFSFVPGGSSPFGTAEYRLVLHCEGEPQILTLELPEIFTDYTLRIDGKIRAVRGSGTQVEFPAEEETELVLRTENHSHYYSGLTYPPALGIPSVIDRLALLRSLFYAALIISSVTLSLFSLILWSTRQRDPLFFHFGLLCLAVAVQGLHPFVWQLGGSGPLSYALEDAARLLTWAEAAAISTVVAGWHETTWFRRGAYPFLLTAAAACFMFVTVIIPGSGGAVNPYGMAMDGYRMLCWLYLAVCAGVGAVRSPDPAAEFTLAGCSVLGFSLFANLLDNNYFEPIHTGWQSEWANFLLVLIFAGLMIWRNAAILKENLTLTTHLEELVEVRTAELSTVLEERKRFFSDMAHNLKAPIAAIHGFITLIREGGVEVDEELKGYIALIENENLEMRRRIQALNTLNDFDRMGPAAEEIDLDELLAELYACNEPEASAAGIHFEVGTLGTSVSIHGQREKLMTLFENLIYNALSFTPQEGTISIQPRLEGSRVAIQVRDTGCGIGEEHLPHIFERFYTVRKQKNEGSGLGLYIVKLTVEEMGGSVEVSSTPGEGTVFTIRFPSIEEASRE